MHITDQDLENLYEPLSVEINQISYSGDIIQYKPTAYQSSDDAFSNLQVGLMEVELKQDELYEQVDNMEIGQYLANSHITDEPEIIEVTCLKKRPFKQLSVTCGEAPGSEYQKTPSKT